MIGVMEFSGRGGTDRAEGGFAFYFWARSSTPHHARPSSSSSSPLAREMRAVSKIALLCTHSPERPGWEENERDEICKA